jgi:hypothetical protein
MYCILFGAGIYYKVRCKLHLTYLRLAHLTEWNNFPATNVGQSESKFAKEKL